MVSGLILSGGKSTRMEGANKAFLHIEGQAIIERTIALYKDIFKESTIATNNPLEYVNFDARIVTDIIKNKGALGGLYTGLFYSTCDYTFVAACDMPFLNRQFISYMISNIGTYDLIVPQLTEGYQPLHAIYSKRCLPAMKKNIESGKLKIADFYKKVKMLVIPDEVVSSFDPEYKMFLNVNSLVDLQKIQEPI